MRSEKLTVRSFFLVTRHSSLVTHSPGFTLLELIIAITILSLVTVIIAGAFRLGIDAWDRGENETENTQRLRALSGMLSQQLKSAYPYKMKLEGEDEELVVFQGDSESLLFVTSLADANYGGFKWVRYSFKEGELLYKEGLLPDKELMENIKGDEELVDENPGGFEIEYFSAEDDEWKDKWVFGKELPVAVQVKISFFQPFVINLPMSLQEEDEDDKEEKLDESSRKI